MALFGSYTPPGVYTDVVIDGGGQPLFGSARVPVIVGEGLEYFSRNNVELHRGSSAVVDAEVVNENLSAQIQPGNYNYQVGYFPVVTGDGTGTVTNDVTKIQVTADGVPQVVTALNGATGVFTLQNIVTADQNLEVSYYFTRTDTFISGEDLSSEVPTFATASQGTLTISVSTPGAAGNAVSVVFATTSDQADITAVSGVGTDTITVQINNATGTPRTLAQIDALLSGVQTATAGTLVCTLSDAGAATATAATLALSGGKGQDSNTTFTTRFAPIVDGSNGGITTTSPSDITVNVNGNPVTVSSVNGLVGSFTLASPVASGATLTVNYYTNNYQNTWDIIPDSGVSSITQIGISPDSAYFVEGTDYVLGTDSVGNSTINWGASSSVASGVKQGSIAFDASVIKTRLVDDYVQLRQATGVCNGSNTTFTLDSIPVDGSGRAIVTNDVTKIKVYVGANAVAASTAGPVSVSSLAGATRTVTLYNAPASGNVYVSYYRNTLADNQYTLKVANANIPGQGTYSITNNVGTALPTVTTTVAATLPDLVSSFTGVSETVTLTFDQTVSSTTPGAQATLTTQGITFLATTPGVAGNAIQIAFDTTTSGVPTVSGDVITIHGALTISQVVAEFPITANGISVSASGSGATLVTTAAALNLSGGVDPVTTSTPIGYTVTGTKSSGIGFFGQTYIDAVTGLRFTFPSNYVPSGNVTMTVSTTGTFVTGSTWNNSIPGIQAQVATTSGMVAGDTAVISTFNKAGNTPAIGEFYYVTYQVPKSSDDMSIKLYNNPADAYAQYGQPSPVNRVSLGIQLMAQNGAQTFGVVQVPKQTGLNTGADQDFISAIQTLTVPLPGSTRKADVIIPLSTSMTVIQYLSRQLLTQASVRNKGEAIGFVGFASSTTSNVARGYARSIKNSRIIAIANPLAGLLMTNPSTGLAMEYAVSGEFMAAAMAGLSVNPANDVATTLTRQNLVGFSRLIGKEDDATMNMMAADGLTVLTENNGALGIRHYKSTDPSNPITSEPTCTTITDYVRQQFRSDLDQFIGRKLVDSLINSITAVCTARLRSLVTNQIITAYQNLSVVPDPVDPTTVNVTVSFKPMFSLLYISVTFNVTTTTA